jgi:plasmid stability protein
MTTITVRHVPDDVRDELAARAADRGQSLQEYLLAELNRIATTPTVASLLAAARADKRRHGSHIGRRAIIDARDADRK